MAENTSWIESVELSKGGGEITVQARKGSRMVTINYDDPVTSFNMHIDAAEAHELRDILTAIMHKLDPQMQYTKKSEPGIGG